MPALTLEAIRDIADSNIIFQRGEDLYRYGAFQCVDADPEQGEYMYAVDGSYGDYSTEVNINGSVVTSCDCPYPGEGCKHVVAVLLDMLDREENLPAKPLPPVVEEEPFLSVDEIKIQAMDDRRKRARTEQFSVTLGDMFKGDHLLVTPKGRQYQVTLHDPAVGTGHCSCPDYLSSGLGTCKHLLFLHKYISERKEFKKQQARERFPYVDIFWDARAARPKLFHEQSFGREDQLAEMLDSIFTKDGLYRLPKLSDFMPWLERLQAHKRVRIQEPVMEKLANRLLDRELEAAAAASRPDPAAILKVSPYPYQEEGIGFGLYKRATLIGDEMGLGKTMQAIALGVLKKEIFGFSKVLVVTLASLKDQWKREIERFSDEKAKVIAGPAKERKRQYREDDSLFKITNYEAVLRDVTIISRFKPDLIILDEAQRIKNFETKTAEAVKSLPRQHALVLTGTPLENKLEDVYSIVQFLDPELLSPLWKFAADHFLISRYKKGQILGYRNLARLHKKLQPLVIRRRKEEVLDDLPEQIVNDYFLDLHAKQAEIHAGYSQSLLPLLNKKFLTPMDLRKIQVLLLKMRQVCDSTHLIDRETNISPKLDELATILDELVVENGRKVVIFSEWTTMTFLIGKHLSRTGIPFVELSGKVPVKKRQALIDEFSTNPDCKVFLSTDAGGTGLNLQAADCVINFELPWNPAKLNQRIGRVNRIGQKSHCVNVINLVTKNSIEMRIMAGIQLKGDLFSGVFDGGADEVMFDRKKRQEMVNQLREMIGEELEPPVFEQIPSEELPEDTPHFLNPEVLRDEEKKEEENSADYTGEETEPIKDSVAAAPPAGPVEQSPEKMEAVLNQGMSFISGLLEMATGQKIEAAGGDGEKIVTLDKETGEVTLKFKLPGF
jgi:superfamily II DNA or RNA helicase